MSRRPTSKTHRAQKKPKDTDGSGRVPGASYGIGVPDLDPMPARTVADPGLHEAAGLYPLQSSQPGPTNRRPENHGWRRLTRKSSGVTLYLRGLPVARKGAASDPLLGQGLRPKRRSFASSRTELLMDLAPCLRTERHLS